MEIRKELIKRCSKCNVEMKKEVYRTVSQRTGALINRSVYRCFICGARKMEPKNDKIQIR